jgi:sec-independent protein translocase protein TatB
MFEVGFTEIILIFGIALLVLGPERLPKLAADLGRWAGRARAMARTLRTQLEQEVRFDPLQDSPTKYSSSSTTIHNPAPPDDTPAPPADENGSAAQLADQSAGSMTEDSSPSDQTLAPHAEKTSDESKPV